MTTAEDGVQWRSGVKRLLHSVKGTNVMNPIILIYYKEWRRIYPLVPAKWILYYAKHCSTGYMHPLSAIAFFGFAIRATKFMELLRKRQNTKYTF